MADIMDELKRAELEKLLKFANVKYTVVEPKSETTVKSNKDNSIKIAKLAGNLWIGIKNLPIRFKERFKEIVDKYNADKNKINRDTIDKEVDLATARLEAAKSLGSNIKPSVKKAEQMNYINVRLQEAGLKGIEFIEMPLAELGIMAHPDFNNNKKRIKISERNIIGKFFLGRNLKSINIKDKEIEEVNKQINLAIARGINDVADIFNLAVYSEKLRDLQKEKLILVKKAFIIKEAEPLVMNTKPLDVQPVLETEKVGGPEKKVELDSNPIVRDGDYVKFTDKQGRHYSDYQPGEASIEPPQQTAAGRFDLEKELKNMFSPLPTPNNDEAWHGFAEEFIENHEQEQRSEAHAKPDEGVIELEPLEDNNVELTTEENQKLTEEFQNVPDQKQYDEMQAKSDSPESKFELAQQDYKDLLNDPNANPKDVAYLNGYMEGLAHQIAGPNQELLGEILSKVNNIEKNVESLRKESLKNHKDVIMTVAHTAQKVEPEINPLKEGRQYIIQEQNIPNE